MYQVNKVALILLSAMLTSRLLFIGSLHLPGYSRELKKTGAETICTLCFKQSEQGWGQVTKCIHCLIFRYRYLSVQVCNFSDNEVVNMFYLWFALVSYLYSTPSYLDLLRYTS